MNAAEDISLDSCASAKVTVKRNAHAGLATSGVYLSSPSRQPARRKSPGGLKGIDLFIHARAMDKRVMKLCRNASRRTVITGYPYVPSLRDECFLFLSRLKGSSV